MIRPVVFLIYSILFCCCDKGRNYENGEFKDTLLSFDYIENALEERNNFENFGDMQEEASYDNMV